MFTLKYVSPHGEENIRECSAVIADKTESGGHPRVLAFDDTPTLAKDNSAGIYVGDYMGGTDELPKMHHGIVYVMNRFGATVATYRL